MGMAASQARYLALTARKTNTEYEGQQINQARTALANQSANLFNQLLRMEVPNPPKTSDYTKVQYSYSDGQTSSVLDEWTQLSGTNPNYNYLVKSHYYASMYTGAMKKLSDPQVQIEGIGSKFDDWSTLLTAKTMLDVADSAQQTAYKTYQDVKEKEDIDILNIQSAAYVDTIGYRGIDSSIDQFLITANTGFDQYDLTNSTTGNTYSVKHFYDPDSVLTTSDATDIETVLRGIQDMLDTNIMDLSTLNMHLVGSGVFIDESNINEILDGPLPKAPGSTYNNVQKAILNVFGIEEDSGISRVVDMSDVNTIIQDEDTSTPGTTVHKHDLSGTFLKDVSNPAIDLSNYAYEINANHKSAITTAETAYNAAYTYYQTMQANYDDKVKPTYIGNSELTPLFTLTADQETELLQVVKDMKAENIDTDILNCFDSANNYLGGIYSFQINGVTYYTTHENLKDAFENSYPGNGSNNVIDAQYKMPYYNASYINKRIEQTSKALLETDGDGRFKSVKFDDNSVVYSLNTETVTDEAAYEDAMNKYVYEKEKYEKAIADINAKTSIIQKEDRTLELRLKQLDTEQNALKTEMDAVKKVIKDNVDSTFKTFSD